MPKQNRQISGDKGEKEVIKKVPCPNCKKELMSLPSNYPLVDVQCTACYFRAQVKTRRAKPENIIQGAGWDILNKTLKAGYMIPPIFVNFQWENSQEIRFYPFIPKANIRHSKRTIKKTRIYEMFNYINMNSLKHFVVYQKIDGKELKID